ncbi:Ig-like domain-containing protein, partial [Ruminococcaceae bacterium OttesenSCG-928-A16]|nr:Ig-like domain-containing protein [Ruminococcaceae bacterium OttesenSCG-928-A16]
ADQSQPQEVQPEEKLEEVVVAQIELPVQWQCAEYDAETEGVYTFVAVLPEGYSYDGTLPTATVKVQAAETLEIDYFYGTRSPVLVRVVYAKGVPIEQLTLLSQVSVRLQNGTDADLPIQWQAQQYNPDEDGTYVFTMVLPEGYLYNHTLPCAEVVIGADPLGTK